MCLQSDDDFVLSHCHMESDGVAQADASKPELPRVPTSGVELICVPWIDGLPLALGQCDWVVKLLVLTS